MLTDNITARVEYRYTDYQDKTFTLGGGPVEQRPLHAHHPRRHRAEVLRRIDRTELRSPGYWPGLLFDLGRMRGQPGRVASKVGTLPANASSQATMPG